MADTRVGGDMKKINDLIYKIGGIAAVLAAALFRRNWGSEYLLLRVMGLFQDSPEAAPIRAADWFALIRDNPFLGLVLLNFFDLVNYLIVAVIYVALFRVLYEKFKGVMVLALVLGVLGVGTYFASNVTFSMMNLSAQHGAAASPEEAAMYINAGEAVLAVNNPGRMFNGTGIYSALFFVFAGGLIFSIAMLKSGLFTTWSALSGILANGIGLTYFIILPTIPALAALPHIFSAIFLIFWYVLIARKLFKLYKGEQE